MTNSMRLQKFLARSGVASRRASEQLIAEGRVTVNGEVVTQLGTKVDASADNVAVDGAQVHLPQQHVTLMLHKPAGVVCTMKAQSSDPIVASLVPLQDYPGLYPIGRLDTDTTGLLLFTNDGDLGHKLLHPSNHVPKTYIAHVRGQLTDEEAQALRDGVMLDDGPTQPAQVEFENGNRSVVHLTIHEGRYHQVKRMLKAVGHPVKRLHRQTFGPLDLGDLKEGTWRLLLPEEERLLN